MGNAQFSEGFMQQVVKEGFSSKYGARPLRRAVQRYVEDVLAECMLEGFAGPGSHIKLDIASPQRVLLSRGDGRSMQIDVDANQSGMEDSSYDEGDSSDEGLDSLVEMMSQAGIMPNTQTQQ